MLSLFRILEGFCHNFAKNDFYRSFIFLLQDSLVCCIKIITILLTAVNVFGIDPDDHIRIPVSHYFRNP